MQLQELCVSKNISISCAESLTFAGGVCCYNIDQKVNILWVDRKTASACNCVSERTAIQMAQGCQKLFGTTFSCATTGYASTYPETWITTPFAWVAIVSRDKVLYTEKIVQDNLNRVKMQRFIAERVVERLGEVVVI